jgi:hypothetical protein
MAPARLFSIVSSSFTFVSPRTPQQIGAFRVNFVNFACKFLHLRTRTQASFFVTRTAMLQPAHLVIGAFRVNFVNFAGTLLNNALNFRASQKAALSITLPRGGLAFY